MGQGRSTQNDETVISKRTSKTIYVPLSQLFLAISAFFNR